MNKLRSLIITIFIGGFLFLIFLSPPVAGQSSGNTQNDSINLCGQDTSDTGDTISQIFLILSVLGPVFGTLFYTGMAVADTVNMEGKYGERRRKVLLLGFSVPVVIVFLEAIAKELLLQDQNIDCFFPGDNN